MRLRSLRRPAAHPVALIALVAIAGGLAGSATAQQLQMPGDAGVVASDAAPVMNELPSQAVVTAGPNSMQYGGSYFNPALGSHIRARYTTQSYGQQEGTLDLGSMGLLEVDGGFAFLDGQVTMNDESHVGYNLGLGYRWITLPLLPWGPDTEKIAGVSIWSDGQMVGGDNFFPQVGVSMEMLGERVDFRANGYIPLGPGSRTRDFGETGNLTYSGNDLVNELIGIRDTAITVGEAELAGRILDLDAWVFGGVYGMNGNGIEATGGKIGLRGYATPDLLLSIAIANDDEFDTNALFTATWFIGRTRAENCPTGTLRDRFREPVLRNNYVATQQSIASSAGAPLLDADGDPIRIVHIDSRTGSNGDGSFENPYSRLDLANLAGGPEQEGDILLVHAGSSYTNDSISLLNEQRLLGEGLFNDPNFGGNRLIEHDVTLLGGDVIQLPATQSNAFSLAAPTVDNGTSTLVAVTMADANEVNNLTIAGGATAVGSGEFLINGTSGAGDPTLRNLTIANTSASAIALNSRVRVDVDDVDNDGDTTERSVEFNVDIDDIVLTNIGDGVGDDFGIDINASDSQAGGPADFGDELDVVVNETIAVDDVTVTDGQAVGIAIRNTNSDTNDATVGFAVVSGYNYDGGTTAGGALLVQSTGGATQLGDSNLTGGASGGVGIAVDSAAGSTFVDATTDIDNVNGTTVAVTGDGGAGVLEGDVTVNAEITNNSGGVVRVEQIDDANTEIEFAAAITSTATDAEGIVIRDNTAGSVTFGQDVSITSGANRAVVVGDTGANQGNGDMSVAFAQLDITTSGANATGLTGRGGVLAVTDSESSVNVTGATGIDLSGVEIADGGVAFSNIAIDAQGAEANAVVLNNLSGANGGVTLGGTDTGTIAGATGDAVLLTNTGVAGAGANAGVTLDSLDIAAGTGTNGVSIVQNNSVARDMRVALNDVAITGATAAGVRVSETTASGNAFGVDLTDTTITGGANGVAIANYDGGTGNSVSGTNVDIGGTGALGLSGSGVSITDSDGTTTFDSGSSITNAAGTAYSVDGGAGSHTFLGDITNTSLSSIDVRDTTGGTVLVGGDLTDTGTGVNVQNNTDAQVDLLFTDATINVATNATAVGVSATGNTNTDVFLANAEVTTQNGNAVNFATNDSASSLQLTDVDARSLGSGTALNVANGSSEAGTVGATGTTLRSNTGQAIVLNNAAIDANGATFSTVRVDAGAGDGVTLSDVTGGALTLGSGSDDGDGGSITTSGLAINATNVADLRARNLTVDGGSTTLGFTNDSTAAMSVALDNVNVVGGDGGLDITHSSTGATTFAYSNSELTIADDVGVADAVIAAGVTGAGPFDLLLSGNTLQSSDADRVGVAVSLASGVTDADVSITGGSYSVQAPNALDVDAAMSSGAVRFELSGAALTNTTAANPVADISLSGTSTLNANVTGNTFNVDGPASEFTIANTAGTIQLNLSANTSANADIQLTSGGTRFALVGADQAAVQNANPNANVDFTGVFDFNVASVPLPNN
ncbi:MAG: hypothetical protein AAF805_01480 [Planctomycetota bacterium]